MTIKNEVRGILDKYPATEKNDKLLILSVFKLRGLETLLGTRSFNDFVEFYFEAPCVETIRRSRQLIMEERRREA